MPEIDQLLERVQQAVELCKTAGAADAWASANRSRAVEFTTRDGKLEKVQESTSRALGIDIYVDGKYSSHSTTDLRPENLQAFVNEAVALTRALQPDPHRLIPDPALFEGRPDVDLDLVDSKLGEVTQAQRQQWCEAMDAAAGEHEAVISTESTVQDDHYLSAAASSNGFSGTKAETGIWFVSSVSLQDEGDKRPSNYDYLGGHFVAELPDPAVVGRGALERALARLGSVKGPTGAKTVVVDRRAGGRLIGSLLSPANARSIQQGRSFWAGKIGQPLASSKLSITDDPLLVRGFASRLFDREGIAARKLPILEGGVARNYYVDTYYGKKAELTPTTGSPSNKVIALGDQDLAALLKDVGEGIYITSWLGGNSDGTTGDFSFGLEGHLIEGGEIGACVGEMNATGNLVDLFMNLVAVGNDPWIYSSTLVPTLVFDGVQISGA
jgi:PmbA protein